MATVLQLLRQPGVPAYDTLWAEDGQVFLADALARTPVDAMFRPLAGYFHFLPRVLGEIAVALPLDAAAAVFAGGSALVVALLSLYVFHASRTVVPATWARLLLAGLAVLLPATATELVNTAANLHFYLFIPTLVALLDRPERATGTVIGMVVVLASTLSDPRLGLLLPAAVVALWKPGSRGQRFVAGSFLVGLLGQAAMVAYSTTLGPDVLAHYPAHASVHIGESTLTDVPKLYGLRVLGPLLVGEGLLDDVWQTFGWWFSAGTLVLVGTIVLVTAARRTRDDRVWITLALALSVVFFTAHAFAWGTREFWPYAEFYLAAGRYVYTPALLVVVALSIALGARTPTLRRVDRVGRFVLVTALTLLVIVNFRMVTWRSEGPRWTTEVRAARAHCDRHGDENVNIAISPAIEGPDRWYVPVSCRVINAR